MARAPDPDASPTRRSIVYLEIDNRQCVQSSSQCFQSTTDVAAFLGALASRGSLNIPYKIEAVKSECPLPASLPARREQSARVPGKGDVPSLVAVCVTCYPRVGACLAFQSAARAFPELSAWHTLLAAVTVAEEAGPGHRHVCQEVVTFFLCPPFPPGFSLLGIISESLQLFAKGRGRGRGKN